VTGKSLSQVYDHIMFFLVVAITVILSVLGSIQAFTTPASTSNVRNGRVFSKRGRMVHDFPSVGSRALYASSSSGKHNRGEKPFFGDGVAVLDDSAELVDCLVRSKFNADWAVGCCMHDFPFLSLYGLETYSWLTNSISSLFFVYLL
jgi:hypothetical protein